MTTRAIIQARMGSSRLPGKVMLPLGDRTVLAHVIHRVRACPLVDEVVVATTVRPADDVVAAEAERQGAGVFRGSEDDVLSRYHHAAAGAEVIVRVTSDCPVFDPSLLESMLREFAAARAAGEPLDYLSVGLVRTFPRGLDAEVFTRQALERAHREATRPHEREHVTPYLYQTPGRFHVRPFVGDEDLSHHRWTLDTEEDLALLREIFDALYPGDPLFSTEKILELLETRPELSTLNAHVRQKELESR